MGGKEGIGVYEGELTEKGDGAFGEVFREGNSFVGVEEAEASTPVQLQAQDENPEKEDPKV